MSRSSRQTKGLGEGREQYERDSPSSPFDRKPPANEMTGRLPARQLHTALQSKEVVSQ